MCCVVCVLGTRTVGEVNFEDGEDDGKEHRGPSCVELTKSHTHHPSHVHSLVVRFPACKGRGGPRGRGRGRGGGRARGVVVGPWSARGHTFSLPPSLPPAHFAMVECAGRVPKFHESIDIPLTLF